jgi:dihydropyrimidinase
MAIVLRGGTIVTAIDYYLADIRIQGEKVEGIGVSVEQPGDFIFDVSGCFLFPGGIDPHTHFDLPVGSTVTADDFESGSKAAILGGTTTIIDYASQFKGETLGAALANWHAKADGKSHCDFGFHLAITDWNAQIRQEMTEVIEAGVASFKFYMAYKHSLQVDDGVLLQALTRAREFGALICVHCENGDVVETLVQAALQSGKTTPKYHPLTRPVAVEREATQRVLTLAELAEAPVYIVHLTCSAALHAVQEARGRGVEVYAETCPQYLLLNDTYYTEDFTAAKYVLSPPLRSADNQERLWQGLFAGEIDTIATDHCAFNFQGQKELGTHDFSKIPNGIPGVQTRLGLLYTYGVVAGRISLNQFVELTSTRAAKLFGLFPRKGTIAIGSDADIVVYDPAAKSVISVGNLNQTVDYTPFEGFAQAGRVVHVFLRGRQVVKDGELHSESPRGIYLQRKPFQVRKG